MLLAPPRCIFRASLRLLLIHIWDNEYNMKLKRTKRLFKERIPNWMDLSRAKEGGQGIVDMVKKLLVPSQPERTETFEQAIQRLGLSEPDIMERQQSFYRLFIIMALVTGGVLGYSFYLLFSGHFMAAMASFAVSLIASAVSFRNHFWHTQLKHRKLGMTVKEWWDAIGSR